MPYTLAIDLRDFPRKKPNVYFANRSIEHVTYFYIFHSLKNSKRHCDILETIYTFHKQLAV